MGNKQSVLNQATHYQPINTLGQEHGREASNFIDCWAISNLSPGLWTTTVNDIVFFSSSPFSLSHTLFHWVHHLTSVFTQGGHTHTIFSTTIKLVRFSHFFVNCLSNLKCTIWMHHLVIIVYVIFWNIGLCLWSADIHVHKHHKYTSMLLIIFTANLDCTQLFWNEKCSRNNNTPLWQ